MKEPSLPDKTIFVVVIDSRPIFRKGLKVALASIRQTMEIIEVSNYQELVEANKHVVPDFFFLGAGNLLDIEILNFSKFLRTQYKTSKITIYDYRRPLDFLVPFFPDRLDGCLLENFDIDELAECIKALTNSKLYISSDIITHFLASKFHTNEPLIEKPLSALENEVSAYLLRGMRTSQIAQLMNKGTSTISTVKSNIFKKTKVNNVLDLALVLRHQ